MSERSAGQQGVVVGLLGAGVVAAWFLALDLILGRPFFTPATLGSAVFLGVRDLEAVEVSVAMVLGYSVLHLAAFLLLGWLVVVVTRRARRTPPLLLGAILVFVVFQALFMGIMAILAEFVLGALTWWAIAIGNLLAAGAMGYFIWERDPALKEAVRREPFDRTH
jgi:hypothetical protein